MTEFLTWRVPPNAARCRATYPQHTKPRRAAAPCAIALPGGDCSPLPVGIVQLVRNLCSRRWFRDRRSKFAKAQAKLTLLSNREIGEIKEECGLQEVAEEEIANMKAAFMHYDKDGRCALPASAPLLACWPAASTERARGAGGCSWRGWAHGCARVTVPAAVASCPRRSGRACFPDCRWVAACLRRSLTRRAPPPPTPRVRASASSALLRRGYRLLLTRAGPGCAGLPASGRGRLRRDRVHGAAALVVPRPDQEAGCAHAGGADGDGRQEGQGQEGARGAWRGQR